MYAGPTYKGNAMSPQQEGNLVYLGDDPSLYSQDLYKLEDKGEDKTLSKENATVPLIGFMRDLSAIDPQTEQGGSNDPISKLISPQHTLIHTAFSFLIGSWDGFWYQASNYYINQDLQSNQWALITYDFDEVFGNNQPDESFMTVPYTQYGRPNASRPLVDKLLQSPYWNSQFQDILKTVIKRFYKPSVIGPRLEAWINMLREDIAWDRSLQPRSPGTSSNWTVDDFVSNMNGTTKGQVGILEFITKRSASVCQQLSFQDTDDLPPLGPYTGGRYMDTSGQITDHPSSSSSPVASSASAGVSPSGGNNSASSVSPFFMPILSGLLAYYFFIVLWQQSISLLFLSVYIWSSLIMALVKKKSTVSNHEIGSLFMYEERWETPVASTKKGRTPGLACFHASVYKNVSPTIYPSLFTTIMRRRLALFSLLLLLLAACAAADTTIRYAVVAFPSDKGVGVSVNGQTYPLAATEYPNLYAGTAPVGDTYQYVLPTKNGSVIPESTTRQASHRLNETFTGHEFFNRSRTVYDVPSLPQAYHPIYPRKFFFLFV